MRTRRRPCCAAPSWRSTTPAAADPSAAAAVLAAVRRLCEDGVPEIAVAVSGGSDSLGLLALAADARDAVAAAGASRPVLTALTVDHGLRPESAREAEQVRAIAARLGCAHQTLRWAGDKPAANLQAAAREARYRLMAGWRRAARVGPLLLGHTRDDVAETLLLRLARGSGVDGLAAMAPETPEEPAERAAVEARPRLRRLRPLLGAARADLRRVCRARGLLWIDDPSNEDPRFERVKIRRLLAQAEPLGLSTARLAKTAETMARARAALERATDDLQARRGAVDRRLGTAQIAATALSDAPREIALRWLARALAWTAGAAYPPRLDSLEAALDALLSGAAARRTLHGCLIDAVGRDGRAPTLRVMREPAATAEARPLAPGEAALWDNRYRVLTTAPGRRVAPVGREGRATLGVDAPAEALESMAGIWRDGELVATPFGAAAPALDRVEPRPNLARAEPLGAGFS